MKTEKPLFVSITKQESNKLRIYISDALLLEMQTIYVCVDLDSLTLIPCQGPIDGVVVRKITSAGFVFISGGRTASSGNSVREGRYEAVRHGEMWRLRRTGPNRGNCKKPIVEETGEAPGWPYRIHFPKCAIVDGYFKML